MLLNEMESQMLTPIFVVSCPGNSPDQNYSSMDGYMYPPTIKACSIIGKEVRDNLPIPPLNERTVLFKGRKDLRHPL